MQLSKNWDKYFALGLCTNAFSLIVTGLLPVISVPIFLSLWNLDRYGEWLILVSISIYFGLLDGGISLVAMNKMTLLKAQNKTDEASVIFQSALGVISAVIVIFFIVTLGILSIATALSTINDIWPFLALALTALLNIYNALIDGVFRSSNKYILGTNLITIGKLVEWTISIAGLIIFKTFDGCAYGLLLGRLIAISMSVLASSFCVPSYKWRFQKFSYDECILLINKSKLYVLFPISSAIKLQGSILLIGVIMGPAVAANFNILRSISRALTQLTGAFAHTLWPRFTRFYARGEINEIIKETSHWTLMLFILNTVISLIIVWYSESIFQHWTTGKLTIDKTLLIIFMISSIISASTIINYTLIVSINSFGNLPKDYLVIAILNSILILFMGYFFGLYGIAVAMIVAEMITLYITNIRRDEILSNKI